MTPQILAALQHVKTFYPEVSMVVFNRQGLWQYMSQDFDCPKDFSKLDISILEDAADSVVIFPSVFSLDIDE